MYKNLQLFHYVGGGSLLLLKLKNGSSNSSIDHQLVDTPSCLLVDTTLLNKNPRTKAITTNEQNTVGVFGLEKN